MGEVEKESSRTLKASFVVAMALVGTLAISSLWLFMRTDSLQIEVGDLEKNNESFKALNLSLGTEVDNLTDEKDDLQKTINGLTRDKANLQSQVDSLNREITSLKKAQLHRVADRWGDNHPSGNSPYANYYGNIFNSGSKTAYNVVITVRIYDAFDTLLKTEEIDLGRIEGKSYQAFDVDIEYSGDADYLKTVLVWN